MNPTLYDILGVDRDASPAQIKAAWRDAAERFEPGSGGSPAQFRLFNEAAETLLDPERRRTYDAGLDPGPSTAAMSPAQDEAPEGAPDTAPDTAQDTARGTAAAETAPVATTMTVPRQPAEDEPGDEARPARVARAVPTAVLALLAAAAVALVVVVAVLGLQTWKLGSVQGQAGITAAQEAAPAAAERAAAAILSYGYQSLDADEKAAEKLMTAKYQKQYAATFDRLVKPNATKIKATVEADVRSSGVVRAEADRATVLLFVNQTTKSTANNGQPQQALNRVQLTMVRENGTWLVDGITSY